MTTRYKSAVGLDYNEHDGYAPRVAARGELLSADEIVKIARAAGVPVVEKSALARVLSQLEPDQEIPPDLYEVVAAILAEIEKRQRQV